MSHLLLVSAIVYLGYSVRLLSTSAISIVHEVGDNISNNLEDRPFHSQAKFG